MWTTRKQCYRFLLRNRLHKNRSRLIQALYFWHLIDSKPRRHADYPTGTLNDFFENSCRQISIAPWNYNITSIHFFLIWYRIIGCYLSSCKTKRSHINAIQFCITEKESIIWTHVAWRMKSFHSGKKWHFIILRDSIMNIINHIAKLMYFRLMVIIVSLCTLLTASVV
jgi:hypothetical protein